MRMSATVRRLSKFSNLRPHAYTVFENDNSTKKLKTINKALTMTDLEVNNKCLAYHGPLLYEAKIVKIREAGASVVRTKDGEEPIKLDELNAEVVDGKAYFIHYKGWKSSWDEWVSISRLKEFTVDNLRLQKELKRAALNATSSVSASNGKRSIDVSKPSSGGIIARATKRRTDMDTVTEEEYLRKPEINILIPDSLKALLVDDWEMITKEHQLLQLPCKPNVDDLLRKFRQSLGKKSTIESEILDEFLSGMAIYFNKSLGNILLYRFERQQYLEVTKNPELKDLPLSEVYGPEHLLRLMVSLPALISQTTMDQQSVATLKEHIESLLIFLERHKRPYFLKKYENVTPGYEALAKTV